MVKWQIGTLTLEVNPSSYSRSKQVEVSYEQLADGSQCRVVAPITFKKEEFQLVWANVNQAQLNSLSDYIGQKVVIKDHLNESSTVYVDGVAKQYLISGTPEQRYAVNIKVREV